MKYLFLLIFTLALQNANAGDTIFFNKNPSMEFLVLWSGRVVDDGKFSFPSGSKCPFPRFQIDTILRKVGEVDEILKESKIRKHNRWISSFYCHKCPLLELKANTVYVALSKGIALDVVYSKWLNGDCEDILPDIPKNRQKLMKKFKNTTVIYKDPHPRGIPLYGKSSKDWISDTFTDRSENLRKSKKINIICPTLINKYLDAPAGCPRW
jgi:hypothetical protein